MRVGFGPEGGDSKLGIGAAYPKGVLWQGVERNPASCWCSCAVSLLQTGQPCGVHVCLLPCDAVVCPVAWCSRPMAAIVFGRALS